MRLPSKVGWYLLVSVCMLQCGQAEDAEAPRLGPNIVFIMGDDVGWNEFGYNGEVSYTPHIDALKKQSLSLTQFYVHAVCAPSRAAFLTGKYPFRTWSDWRSEDFGKPSYLEMLGLSLATNVQGEESRMVTGLPTEETTIAEALSDLGYRTGIMGKWHCGEWFPEHLPMGQGFDTQYGHYAWGIDYTNFTIPHNAPARFAVYDWHRDQQPIAEEGYSTDLIANEVVQSLSTHQRDFGDQPFFYYVPFNAIHGPLESIPRYTDSLDTRYAALKCFDDAVGNIVGSLDQYGFAENTLVVITNDNGGLRPNMNAPYRGTKNTNYEGGVRSPCLVRWPSKIAENVESNALMHITDFFDTFVALAGGTLQGESDRDGMDMSATLLEGKDSPRERIIFEVAGSVRPPAIRRGRYKLIGEELFDIATDPYEQSDIAVDHPEIVRQLVQELETASAERPPMPDVSRVMDPALPWVYGQEENAQAPAWLKDHMRTIRSTQPQKWAPGTTPWPQAPKDGKIIYTGDGR